MFGGVSIFPFWLINIWFLEGFDLKDIKFTLPTAELDAVVPPVLLKSPSTSM
jgi:hypothetical protein